MVLLSYECSMGDIISTLKENWAVIVDAPLAFAIWTLVLAALLWAILTWAKSNHIGDLKSRLSLKDDLIAEYQRKLNGASPQQAHRRKVIADGRELITTYSRYIGDKDLLTWLNSYQGWPAIRAHIDKNVLARIEKDGLFIVGTGGVPDGKVSLIRGEIDRLEREWDLT